MNNRYYLALGNKRYSGTKKDSTGTCYAVWSYTSCFYWNTSRGVQNALDRIVLLDGEHRGKSIGIYIEPGDGAK